jgi:folylpolyglutamate synthase/dihydropteroate synthase
MPRVAAVTSIGLDHTDLLGDTLEAIAGEKAGIFKAEFRPYREPAAAIASSWPRTRKARVASR